MKIINLEQHGSEVLIQYFAEKDGDELSRLMKTDKDLQSIAHMEHPTWSLKFEEEFPHLKPKTYSCEAYLHAYHDEYKNLTIEQRKLFINVKKCNEIVFNGMDLYKLRDKNNWSVLKWANKKNNKALLDFAFETMKEPLLMEIEKYIALAAICNKTQIVNNYLAQYTIDNTIELTLFEEVIVNGGTEMLNNLIHQGLDVNLFIENKYPPLWLAVINNEIEMCKILLDNGADVNVTITSSKDKWYKETLLHYASSNGSADIIEILLKYGANVNARDDRDYTPLLFAITGNFHDCVKILLDNGADINAHTKYYPPIFSTEFGITDTFPLYKAAAKGNEEIVQTLLEYGADFGKINTVGKRSIQIAKENGHDEITKMLARSELINCLFGRSKALVNNDAYSLANYIIPGKIENHKNFSFFKQAPREDVQAAGVALLNYINNEADISSLDKHEHAINHSELKTTYQCLRKR